MNNISIIVAIDANNGIGFQNKLLCKLPSDLVRFKQITSGHTVIMGENTYRSLPIFPLPKRNNIIISLDKNLIVKGAIVVNSIESVLDLIESIEDEVFIMGGASIYKQFLPLADKLYLTRIKKEFEADTFFPVIDEGWKTVSSDNFLDGDLEYDFDIMVRS